MSWVKQMGLLKTIYNTLRFLWERAKELKGLIVGIAIIIILLIDLILTIIITSILLTRYSYNKWISPPLHDRIIPYIKESWKETKFAGALFIKWLVSEPTLLDEVGNEKA